jgi:hypothetical protein
MMRQPTISDAIQSLVGGATSGNPLNYESTIYHDGQTPPTKVEAEAKLTELQAEYDAQEYARKREAEYPSVQECVHAILDDTLDALQAKRVSVKLKYPKGG